MKIIAVIQSRLDSQRFPRKALELINGRPMIAHVVERAKAIKGVDGVVVVVPSKDWGQYSNALGGSLVQILGGSEHDVLHRFVQAARLYNADAVMRITGDCPLFCPLLAREVLQYFYDHAHTQFVDNDTCQPQVTGAIDGFDCEVFSRKLLEDANKLAQSAHDREHVTTWMKRERGYYMIQNNNQLAQRFSPISKLSVDTKEDLELVRKIYKFLEPGELTSSDTLKAVEAGR
jgi:spore coat polysaccharide biosynthesis protein SpsF (cytidylyltransferase family)